MAHNFSQRNFRDRIAIPAIVDAFDADGSPTRTWSTVPADWTEYACRVEFNDPTGRTSSRIDGPAPHGETVANVIFQGRPATAIGVDTPIYHVSGGGGAISPVDCYLAVADLTDRGLGLFSATIVRRK